MLRAPVVAPARSERVVRSHVLNPAYLMASLCVSGVGFVLVSYGSKQRRFPYTALGVILLIYPYFVTDVGIMLAIAAGLIALLIGVVKLGM